MRVLQCQRVAEYYMVLQCIELGLGIVFAVRVLQCVEYYCMLLQCKEPGLGKVCCSACVAVCCSVLQSIGGCCSV